MFPLLTSLSIVNIMPHLASNFNPRLQHISAIFGHRTISSFSVWLSFLTKSTFERKRRLRQGKNTTESELWHVTLREFKSESGTSWVCPYDHEWKNKQANIFLSMEFYQCQSHEYGCQMGTFISLPCAKISAFNEGRPNFSCRHNSFLVKWVILLEFITDYKMFKSYTFKNVLLWTFFNIYR